jgi:cellulose synthase/poly-beta-1,6-N-acetylglucosamine synthase-like glycosyltransferase
VVGTLTAANDGVVQRLVQLEVEDRYRGMAAAVNGVDFIAAPSCGFKRDIFLGMGGFNESLRQAEDVELAYRFDAAGHRIAFVADAPVAHAHQTTWGEFISTKYRRAVGRLKVFALYPQKRRQDAWTPLALKLQFAAVALAIPATVAGIFRWPFVLLGLGLLVVAILLGWPLVIATARRQASLIGLWRGFGVGAAFIIIRSLIILLAVMRMKLWRAGSP